MVVFTSRPFLTFLNAGTTDKTFQQFGKQDSLRHLSKSSARCKKLQAQSILEPPLEYNQDQMPLTNQGSL